MGVIKTQAELQQQNDDTHRDEGSDAHKLKGPVRAAESRDLHGNIIATLFGAIGSYQPVPEGVEWVARPTITLTPPVAPATDWTVTVSAGEALWDGAPVPYAARSFTVSLPGDPYQRVDSAFADRQGNYGYTSGRTGLVGIDPAIPEGTLPVGNTYWKSGGGTTSAKDVAYKSFATTGAVTVNYITSPNHKGPASSTTGITATNIPDGGDLRILLEACTGQTITIGGTGNVDLFTGAALPSIKLPDSGNCLVLVNNVSGVLRWSWTGGTGGAADLSGYQKKAGFVAFAAVSAFDSNKSMELGGTGDAFKANHVLDAAASGNVTDTYRTVIVTGNGTNTVSLAAGWLDEKEGASFFDATSGKKNVIRMHWLDANNRFYTITQPA